MSKHSSDNHSNQLNPNNDAYWNSRGWDERPDDWQERIEQDDVMPDSSQATSSKNQG